MIVFVSYSPADNDLVSAIISLLSASNTELVYRDAESLRTGRGAREDLQASIAESDIVLVFWCHHAFTSYDVRKECDLALVQGKDMLPVLLDDTPLPRKVADRRTIDFRARVGVMHEISPDQKEPDGLVERAEVDRLIATDMDRHYEELLVMGLAREIETELAARLRRK
jgi:TIR domain-containing protein